MAFESIPPGWRAAIATTLDSPAIIDLERAVQDERDRYGEAVLPPAADVFAALEATPLDDVRAVILGQDPYPTIGQAMGLAFSLAPGTRPLPGSFLNILRELETDMGKPVRRDGSLVEWTRNGVLLLNTILTVRRDVPLSHKDLGWQVLTGAILEAVASTRPEAVPILWGAYAQRFAARNGFRGRPAIASAHPSPKSAWHGFVGSRPFSRANAMLEANGAAPIDWSL